MRSTFKVLFYLKRNAPKKNGLVPVMCRITVNGKIAQFSCKLDVEEKSWNVKLGRVSGRSIVAQEANRMLDKIHVGINQAYQKIADRDNYVTAEKVRNAYCNNTVWSYMMPFRKIIYMAVNNGLLQRDPFFAYRITKEETKRGFLTKEEIKLLIDGTFKKPGYTLIRDLFVFCTFTGLSWTDMANLTKANLQTSFDWHLWLNTNRQKTGVETNIRLLDVAKHIIEKYEGIAEGDKLLPVPCYENCKRGIKAIAKKCGIQKNVTWHLSRHTYATTVCLSNDVPIETLSKMLGHRSIRTTQIYAKITAEKVSRDMEKLSQRIEQMESFICQAI